MSEFRDTRDPTPPRVRITFEMWREKVDSEVQRRTGLSIDDLPDCPYRDWFDDAVNSTTAAARAIRRSLDMGDE